MIAEKLKQLTKDTAIYGISTILGRFLNFLLVPFYTNVFMPEEYGIVSNVYALVALLNVFYLYGMDAAFMKFAANKDETPEKEIFSTAYISVLISSLVFSLLIVLLQKPIIIFLGIPDSYTYLVYFIGIILFVDSVSAIPFIKLRLERQAKKFALYKFLNILVNVALNILLIVILKWGLTAVFISNLAASLLTLILLSPEIRKYLKIIINKELFRRLIKFGIPYLPAGLASIIIQVIDRPILEHMTDLYTVGIYQANYRLGIFMMLFVNMFQFAWQPFFLQNAKEEKAGELFSKVLTYFVIAASLILVSLSLFIDDIVRIHFFGRTLIGPAYWSGVSIVPIVLLGYLFNGVYFVFSAGIFIKEKTIYIPFITAGGAIINVVVNILLIPIFGITGAASATLASYLFMAVALYFVTQRFYRINYELNKIAKIFFLVGIVSAVYIWLLYSGNLLFHYKVILMMLYIGSIILYIMDKSEYGFLKSLLKSRTR